MKAKHYPFSMTILLLANVCFGRQQDHHTVSLYGLKSINMPLDLVQTIQEHIEASLCASDHYSVLTRSDIDKILQEYRFQQSLDCEEYDCLIKAGNLLGVEKIVTGSISKISGTYSIVLKLIDVKSGRLEHSASRQYSGPVDSLIAISVEAAKKLLAKEESSMIIEAAPDTVMDENTRSLDAKVGWGALLVLVGVATMITLNKIH